MKLTNLMNEADGQWNVGISDFEYQQLKWTSEMDADSSEFELKFDAQLTSLALNEKDGSKYKWLKCLVCQILSDPEVAAKIQETPIWKRKRQLLEMVIDRLVHIGVAGPIIHEIAKLLVWIIKRYMKKAIEGWCATCVEG